MHLKFKKIKEFFLLGGKDIARKKDSDKPVKKYMQIYKTEVVKARVVIIFFIVVGKNYTCRYCFLKMKLHFCDSFL
jgi:hypothetical protein